MSLSKITINETNGIGRTLTSDTNKSGFVFYLSSSAVPSGLTTASSYQFFSLAEAEAQGCTSTASPVAHYHISEFYRINPSGLLQAKFVATSTGSTTFSEVLTLQTDADGVLHQIAVYNPNRNFTSGQVDTLQGVMSELKTDDMPAVAIFAANFTGFTNLSTLPDLSMSSNNLVSVCIGQDGAGRGKELFAAGGKSITAIGAMLGTVAVSNTHESIAWTGKFNASGNDELDTLAFANGTSYKNVSKTLLGQINDKRYTFPLKYYGLNGSFWSGSYSAIGGTSDFFSIERNRVVNKARRLLRTAMLPELNSPLYLNEDGILRTETIGKFKSLCEQSLDAMKRNGELSNYKITIDPAQHVLEDDEVEILVKLQPVGVSRYITISLGYTVSVA